MSPTHSTELPVRGRGDAAAAGELATALSLAEEFGGGRLLLSEGKMAFLLMNHARHRVVRRLFAVSPDQANLVTLIAVLMLADAAHRKFQRLFRAPSVPSSGDWLLTGASLRELLLGVAGSPARDAPLAGALLAIAVLGSRAGPAAFKPIRAIRMSSRRANVRFHNRYGYIVDPGDWRQRRAQRQRGG